MQKLNGEIGNIIIPVKSIFEDLLTKFINDSLFFGFWGIKYSNAF